MCIAVGSSWVVEESTRLNCPCRRLKSHQWRIWRDSTATGDVMSQIFTVPAMFSKLKYFWKNFVSHMKSSLTWVDYLWNQNSLKWWNQWGSGHSNVSFTEFTFQVLPIALSGIATIARPDLCQMTPTLNTFKTTIICINVVLIRARSFVRTVLEINNQKSIYISTFITRADFARATCPSKRRKLASLFLHCLVAPRF